MLGELEAAVADSLRHLTGRSHKWVPAPGAACANCGAELQGPFCHLCGQDADTHKRSILHLGWEALENLFHLDGRLLRTAPDLFLRPGRLARDYLDGRIARHVPPFRTFLVALLLFIFAAEHATHELTKANERREAARHPAALAPSDRADLAAHLRLDAASDRDAGLEQAAEDRAEDLKDPNEDSAHVEVAYASATGKIQSRYDADMAKADRIARGLPADLPAAASAKGGWWRVGLRKAKANPDYYLAVLFTWAHRMAVLLLPIVGFSLALVYRNKRQYFLYDHLLVAMNLLSFAFLTNAFALILPPALVFSGLGLVAIWTPINLFQTLRGAYGSSVLGAVLKTLIVWMTTVVAFGVLLIALLVFTLAEL